tara:strand:+ start:177 stop:596 length:420 start_codon:yes stop_codon:yes gene_type:complete
MAFIIKNKFVDDLNANQAIGVSIPFSSTSVFNQTFDTATQTKSNLINYFLTNKGERLLNPAYGGDLRNFLFEGITPDALEILQKRLEEDIVLRFPIVEVKSLTVDATDDQNLINITLIYNVLNLEDEVIEIGVETNSSL